MSPLRPILYPRYRGYVCPSCIAKLQAPRRPPWLIRNATSSASQDEHGHKIRQKQGRIGLQLPDDDVTIRHFDEGVDGALEQTDEGFEEDTIKELKSRLAALEADLQKLKAGKLLPQGMSFVDELLASKIPPDGGLPSAHASPGECVLNLHEYTVLI
jgi:hypothetical protein